LLDAVAGSLQPQEAGVRDFIRKRVAVQDRGGVGDEVTARVFRPSRLVGDRPADVAVVVADHVPASVGQQPAEALVPPEHRGADPHDEEDGGIGRVPERLGAELDPVRFDHAFRHPLPMPRRPPAWSRSAFPVVV